MPTDQKYIHLDTCTFFSSQLEDVQVLWEVTSTLSTQASNNSFQIGPC